MHKFHDVIQTISFICPIRKEISNISADSINFGNNISDWNNNDYNLPSVTLMIQCASCGKIHQVSLTD